MLRIACLLWCAQCLLALPGYAQSEMEETLGGPDSHEAGQGPHSHLFGDWDGERSRLLERGVRFDFQYVSDSLWNVESVQPERFASWNRFRWTVDIDFGTLTGHYGLYSHATALWQAGGNLGASFGTLTSPSGMSSENTCRLDSWWIEQRWLHERLTVRLGQFAGQDFYGCAAPRRILHLRANALRARQSVYDHRSLRPAIDARYGSSRGASSPKPKAHPCYCFQRWR
jgi:porin